MEILTKENLVGTKTAPTAVSRTFTPLLRKLFFLTQAQKEKSADMGVGGGKMILSSRY